MFKFNENIKYLLRKVANDQELAKKFSAIKDVDEAYELASSIQSGFSKEEFLEAVQKVKSAFDTFNELSDEDLAKVAGGLSTTQVATISVSGSVVSGAVTAIAVVLF